MAARASTENLEGAWTVSLTTARTGNDSFDTIDEDEDNDWDDKTSVWDAAEERGR